MKRLLWVILAAMVLGAVVPGCHHVPRYDGRLTAADSLIQKYPDSVLAMLEAMVPNSTAPAQGEVARSDGGGGVQLSDADRAYHALLLTQARYKCYVTATSDSDINLALSYFRAHPADREKLTRAFIYKGAVMDELGHPDSAMFYYKTAEEIVDSDDYFNLGYVKMRMGALYRDNHAMDGKDIKKYEEALECLNRTDNKSYQLKCMVNLGSLYCQNYPNKADSLLTIALTLAEQMKDTIRYVGAAQNLIKNDINIGRCAQARIQIQKVMVIDTSLISPPLCLYAGYVYAKLNLIDSAKMFLNQVKGIPLSNVMDRIAAMDASGEIALALGDTSRYVTLKNESYRLSDSLQSVKPTLEIMKAEDQINLLFKDKAKESQRKHMNWYYLIVLLLVIILVTGCVFVVNRRKSHNDRITQLEELLESSRSELSEVKRSLDNLKKFDIKDSKLRVFLNSYMSLMREVVEECYRQPKHKHIQKIKDVIKFQKANKDKWEKLYGYIDIEYHDIISKTQTDFPHLDDKEILLIALSTMDFSCMEIAMIMGYSNQTSIGPIRQRLAQKMNLTSTLNDYIAQFK